MPCGGVASIAQTSVSSCCGCRSYCCSCFSYAPPSHSPSLSLSVSFFDFTAKLRMRMQQTAFLLWPFAIVPPMCCQFGAQRSALATVAASYAGFLVPASAPAPAALCCCCTFCSDRAAFRYCTSNCPLKCATITSSQSRQRAASKPKIKAVKEESQKQLKKKLNSICGCSSGSNSNGQHQQPAALSSRINVEFL